MLTPMEFCSLFYTVYTLCVYFRHTIINAFKYHMHRLTYSSPYQAANDFSFSQAVKVLEYI